ncbi:Hypothetical protein Eab7_0715 [Exiguobacterium antarcticum B7]|nr:Hypothetical protein Eab7_0715 [Exiguobacterium antarcticum B7]
MMHTTNTYPLAHIHCFLLTFYSTRRTDLGRGEPLIRFDKCSPIECAFVFQLSDELIPTDISNRFGNLMVLHHVLRFKCLDDDDLVIVNHPFRKLMKKILTLMCKLFMFLGEDHPSLLSVLTPDFLAGQSASSDFRRKRGLSTFSETRSSFVRMAKCSKPRSIPTLFLAGINCGLIDKDGDEEFPGLRHRDRRGLDHTIKRTMLCQLHKIDFRKFHLTIFDADASLQIVCCVRGSVVVLRFELRKPDRLISKKVVIRLV